MHPNRSKEVPSRSVGVAVSEDKRPLRAISTRKSVRLFTQRFLNKFPNSRVLGIDGASGD